MSYDPIPRKPEERFSIVAWLKERGVFDDFEEPDPIPRVITPYFDPPLELVTTQDGPSSSSIVWTWLRQLLRFLRRPIIMLGGLTTRAKIKSNQKPTFSIEEILQVVESRLYLNVDRRHPIFRLDAKTIVKMSAVSSAHPSPTEAFNLLLVRAMTTIPVPSVYQVIMQGDDVFMVMDYIDGETLANCWPKLSLWKRLWIVMSLRGYLAQLRRLKSFIPGPCDGSICQGGLFTEDGAGPFGSYQAMTEWYNSKLDLAKRKGTVAANVQPFDNAWPLVFTHNDLNMGNIMLGRDGRVYIIDWGMSGFYPLWYEHAGMAFDGGSHTHWRSWQWVVPIITGGWRGMLSRYKDMNGALYRMLPLGFGTVR